MGPATEKEHSLNAATVTPSRNTWITEESAGTVSWTGKRSCVLKFHSTNTVYLALSYLISLIFQLWCPLMSDVTPRVPPGNIC